MRLLLVLAALAAIPATAFAKAPTLAELPTTVSINKMAGERIAARLKAEEEAKKDPKMDLINAYSNGNTKLMDFSPVAEILKTEKEEPRYRQAAAMALRQRFKDVRTDTRIRDLKKKIGQSICGLLVDNDATVRTWVHQVFSEYWPGESSRIRYDPNETNYPKRYKAYREWRKYLFK
jgi:hypothetical protein